MSEFIEPSPAHKIKPIFTKQHVFKKEIQFRTKPDLKYRRVILKEFRLDYREKEFEEEIEDFLLSQDIDIFLNSKKLPIWDKYHIEHVFFDDYEEKKITEEDLIVTEEDEERYKKSNFRLNYDDKVEIAKYFHLSMDHMDLLEEFYQSHDIDVFRKNEQMSKERRDEIYFRYLRLQVRFGPITDEEEYMDFYFSDL
jgi:hypothetical protein